MPEFIEKILADWSLPPDRVLGEAGATLSGGEARRLALSRLLVVAERYPELKSNQNFLALQSQLEGTENRITVERQRYIETVQDYNTYIRSFPQNLVAMMFGYKDKPNFSVENEKEISTAPKVDFNPAPAPSK